MRRRLPAGAGADALLVGDTRVDTSWHHAVAPEMIVHTLDTLSAAPAPRAPSAARYTNASDTPLSNTPVHEDDGARPRAGDRWHTSTASMTPSSAALASAMVFSPRCGS